MTSRHVTQVTELGAQTAASSRYMVNTPLKVHYSFHKSLKTVHTPTYSLNANFNIIIVPMPLLPDSQGFLDYAFEFFSRLPLRTTHPAHPILQFLLTPLPVSQLHTSDALCLLSYLLVTHQLAVA